MKSIDTAYGPADRTAFLKLQHSAILSLIDPTARKLVPSKRSVNYLWAAWWSWSAISSPDRCAVPRTGLSADENERVETEKSGRFRHAGDFRDVSRCRGNRVAGPCMAAPALAPTNRQKKNLSRCSFRELKLPTSRLIQVRFCHSR